MKWAIQIQWNGRWVTVETGYTTQDDAEWATAKWKQANRCTGDPFRAVQIDAVGVPVVNSQGDPFYDRAARIKEAELG